MLAVCRVGDLGIGACMAAPHPPIPVVSVIIQGDASHIVEGMACAQFSGISVCSCGHVAVAIQAAANHISTGLGVHRMSDTSVTPAGAVITMQGAARTYTGN